MTPLRRTAAPRLRADSIPLSVVPSTCQGSRNGRREVRPCTADADGRFPVKFRAWNEAPQYRARRIRATGGRRERLLRSAACGAAKPRAADLPAFVPHARTCPSCIPDGNGSARSAPSAGRPPYPGCATGRYPEASRLHASMNHRVESRRSRVVTLRQKRRSPRTTRSASCRRLDIRIAD